LAAIEWAGCVVSPGYSTSTTSLRPLRNSATFSDAPTRITLQPGETIAPGFIDANPNGTGGSGAEVIRWTDGGGSVWHGGGPLDTDTGSLAIGQPPVPGTQLATSQPRTYHFSVSYIVASLELGNNLDQTGFKLVDGASSNFVVNHTESFTNPTAQSLTVSVDRFRFHASRVSDPLTPFVVRINSPGNFTLLAIGNPQENYVLGENDLPFSGASTTIVIAPGETIAPGFVDNRPDGTPGTQDGAVSFIYGPETSDGGDLVTYLYDIDHRASTLELGQAPSVPFRYAGGVGFRREYLFSVTLGFGGKEDEDADGLKDSWELAFSNILSDLSATHDSDGDGMSDLAEYQAGTDPTDSTNVMRTLDIAPGTTGASALIQTVPGRSYQVLLSSDLASWSDAGVFKAANWPASETSILLPASTLPPGGGQKLFIRIAPSP